MIGVDRTLNALEVRVITKREVVHCNDDFYHYTVCEPYELPNDPCVTPSIDFVNNLVEFKCQENCNCQTAYLQCNHTSHQFESVEFSPCVQGILL